MSANSSVEPRVLEFAWPAIVGRTFTALLNGAPEPADEIGRYRWSLPPVTTAVALLMPPE